METLHRFVAAEYILDRTCHHMVDAGHTVGTWRTLIEHERGAALAFFHALFKKIAGFPLLKHLLVDIGKIELIVDVKLFHNRFTKNFCKFTKYSAI